MGGTIHSRRHSAQQATHSRVENVELDGLNRLIQRRQSDWPCWVVDCQLCQRLVVSGTKAPQVQNCDQENVALPGCGGGIWRAHVDKLFVELEPQQTTVSPLILVAAPATRRLGDQRVQPGQLLDGRLRDDAEAHQRLGDLLVLLTLSISQHAHVHVELPAAVRDFFEGGG